MARPATKRAGRPTLADVANRAGVSETAASFTLAGKAALYRISDDTVERIILAARELDYSPNLLVRSMQRGRTGIVAFFNAFRNRLVADLYMDRLSTAVENAAGKRGYNVLVHCDFQRSPEETYGFLNGGHADGVLLFAPGPRDPLLPLMRLSRLPSVLVGAEDPEGVLSSVRDDVRSGMAQIADRLVALGHRHIVSLGEFAEDYPDARERTDLLRGLLAERGAPMPDDCVISWSADRAGMLMELLNRRPAPTAIFCWRDFLAYRLLETCDELGIAVPDQLSVVGYDGLHWPASTRHTVASAAVDLYALAEEAVDLLLERIEAAQAEPARRRIPVSLLTGTTLGTAAQGDMLH